ncbi:MAG: NADP-dependent oxidoreductase [Candidatus Acidiferrales bacterium]
MDTMKAIRIHEYGGPEALKYEDAPRPKPADGEVLIRVHATSVNPVDVAVRQGHFKERMKYKMPFIPGWDVSGVVKGVGPGVTRLKVGDEVYSRPDLSRDGAYAEYIAVRESEVALKPKSLDHTHAAAMPLTSLTAWQALFDSGHLSSGQTVLIHGAAGGVGHFAVQLAKVKGARVIATASKGNHDFLRSLGADEAIDYTTTKFEDVVHNVDVVLDTITGETQDRSWQVIKKGGVYVSILRPPNQETAAAHGVHSAHVFVQPNVDELNEIARLVDAGKVKPHIEKVLPLPQAAAAQEAVATHHTRGKIVISVR